MQALSFLVSPNYQLLLDASASEHHEGRMLSVSFTASP